MSKLLKDVEPKGQRDVHGIFEDFYHYVSGDDFTTVATNSGTVVDTDAAGGVIKIDPSDATQADNDETYVKGTQEVFKFADGKPLVFEARVRPVSNTTTGVANFIVGVKDAVAANSLVDDGAGPAASYSGAVFFLKDGDTTWWCESSIATSQTTVDSNVTATNNTWTTLRIEVHEVTSTRQDVHFFIDDTEVGHDVTTSPGTKIAQTVNPTSATEMQICIGAKNGVANDTQYLDVDYVSCWQSR